MSTIQEKLLKSQAKCGNVKMLAIDGHGGSGKSTLAKLLAKELKAGIILTDDFAGWDNTENWWPMLIKRVFDPIKNGATTLSYPRSKWWETHNPEPVVDRPVTDIMILEGTGSLRKEFRPYIAFSIFVDTPLAVCLRRGFERDRGMDGKSDEEIRRMWEDWHVNESIYIARDNPKESADLVVDGTKSYAQQIA